MSTKEERTMTKVFIPLNTRNKNGRIYTREALEEAVEESQNTIRQMGVLYGELGHPEFFETSLVRVSHTINNIWFEDNKLLGEITLLNTHFGKAVQNIDPSTFVVRPRIAGVVNPDGTVIIKKIFTFDVILKSEDSFYSIQEDRKLKLEQLQEQIKEQANIENSKLPFLKIIL